MRYQIVVCAVLLAGCTHVTHGAYVREGWSVRAELGGRTAQTGADTEGLPTYESNRDLEFQLAVGKAWRAGEQHGVSLTLMVPVSSSSPVGSLFATTFDAYWQALSGPLDLGGGALASLTSPGMYVEAGHRFPRGAELSGGLQLLAVKDQGDGFVPTYALFGLFTVAATQSVRIGLWADYHEPLGVVWACDDVCNADDEIDRWFAGGVTVSLSFGGPDATAPLRAPVELVPAGSIESAPTARGANAAAPMARDDMSHARPRPAARAAHHGHDATE